MDKEAFLSLARTWAATVEGVQAICARIRLDSAGHRADGDDDDPPEVGELATGLRDLLRPYI